MSNKTIDSGVTFTKILLSCIPFVLFLSGILISVNSKTPSVKEQVEIVRDGYAPVPHLYTVDASFSKAWKDGSSFVLIIIGLLISSLGTFFYITYLNKYVKNGSILIIGALWVIGALLIFVNPLKKWSSSSYSSTLTPSEYEKYKNNLDQIFPSIESTEK